MSDEGDDGDDQAIIGALRRQDAGTAFALARQGLAVRPNDLFRLRIVARLGPKLAEHAVAADAARRAVRHVGAGAQDRLTHVARALDVSAHEEAEAAAAALWAEGERSDALTDLYLRLLTMRGALDEAAALLRVRAADAPLAPRLAAQLVGLPQATERDIVNAAAVCERHPSEPLHLALARAFDRRGEPEAALRHLRQTAPLRASWDERAERARIAWMRQQHDRLRPDAAASSDEARPIYLCGPPRSGGTFLQTRLCSAYEAASVGERGALPLEFYRRAGTTLPPALLGDLARADAAGLRRQVGTGRSVDKTPVNGLLAGLLALVHPGAVFVRNARPLREVALSIWLHDFPPAYAYASTLEGTARYLRLHEETLDHWERAGTAMHPARHEAVVRDPGALPRLAETLALAPRATPRQVTAPTHSAVQVREPPQVTPQRYRAYWPLLEAAERDALDGLPD